MTLGGHVASDADKSQAESIGKSFVGSQVLADQIAVVPLGAEEAEAKAVNSGPSTRALKTILTPHFFRTNSTTA